MNLIKPDTKTKLKKIEQVWIKYRDESCSTNSGSESNTPEIVC
jgi:uncharacterized protein YecT (DUF1311 family)